MVGAGTLMILLFGVYAIYLAWAQKIDKPNTGTCVSCSGAAASAIANTAGWIMTEIGRQPWTVFGLIHDRGQCIP